ncbi:MAG: type II secretion system protein GspH [Gammaproteobacteria bacterium]|nr:type II secretion system protein GspH [Gammaproteobacteria bacterium]
MNRHGTRPDDRTLAPRLRHQAGFTLLEVLVVVLIIGIVLSVAVISLPADHEKALQTEAERIDALIGLAQQEAIIQDRELALEIKKDGYRFLIQDGETWTPMSDTTFRARTVEEPIRLDLITDGVPLLQRDNAEDTTNTEDTSPRIFILSSGELSEFTISVRNPDVPVEFLVHGEISGRHTVEKRTT